MQGGGTNCCDQGSNVCYATTLSTCPVSVDQQCWNADNGGAAAKTTCVQTCCAQAYPSGAQSLGALIEACACDSGNGPCASMCANEYCATGKVSTPGDACAQCIAASVASGGSCEGPVKQQCGASGTCSAYAVCANGCP